MTEDLTGLLHNISSLVAVAESFFPNPSDFTRPLRLEPQQVKVFNIAEFGYDIHEFSAPPIYPDGHIYLPRFVLMPWERQAGKSVTCSCLPAAMGLAFPAPVWLGMYGPNEEAAQRLLERTTIMYERGRGNLMRYINKRTLSKHHIEIDNGNKIEAFNSSEKAIRGPTIDFAFIDEIDQFTDPDIVEGAIVPATRATLAKGHGRIFALSTPNKKNANSVFRSWLSRATNDMALHCHGCGKSYYIDEFVTEAIPRRTFSAFRPVPDIPCCPECEKTAWTYIYKHYQIVPGFTPRYTDDQRRMELDQLGNSKIARQELLAEFFYSSGGIFTPEMIEAITDPKLYILPSARPNTSMKTLRVSSVDVGRLRDNTVFCTIEHDLDRGRSNLINLETLEAGEQLDWDTIVNTTHSYINRFHPDVFVPDATGMGDVYVERVARNLLGTTGHVTQIYRNKQNRLGFVFDRISKRALIENLELAVRTHTIFLPPQTERGVEALVDEMLDFGYQFTDTNAMQFTGMSGHDDRVIALALAIWGARDRSYPTPEGDLIRCV